jgi:hypothetical protein
LAAGNRRLRSRLDPRRETTARGGRRTKEEKIVTISTKTHRRYLRRVAVPLLAALVFVPTAAQARLDPTPGAPVPEQPPVAAAADSNGQAERERYELARAWNTQYGQLYGPVEVAPATYGFYSK